MIGTPNEEDKSFVTDIKATQYLNSFPAGKRDDLNLRYPGAGEEAINLLNSMLRFNPYFRTTIDEALNHPFFSKVRKEDKELTAPEKITVEFDQSGETLDRDRLRELFLEEVQHYKK